MLWSSSKLRLSNTPWAFVGSCSACLHRGLIFTRRARRPADEPNQFTLMLFVGGRSKTAWISVAHNSSIYPFPTQYPLPKCMPPSVHLLFNGLWIAILADQNTSAPPPKYIPEYTTETVKGAGSQCPLGEMLCGESNVATRPSTHPPFPLIWMFTCGLLVPRQTGYWTFDFEMGLLLQ